jgi:hypothetical protein
MTARVHLRISDTAPVRPLAVRRRDACAMIGCGTSKLDQLIARGEIEARKSGKNLLILVSSLERYVAGLPPARLKLYGQHRKEASDA